MSKTSTRFVGAKSESAACDYLCGKGYQIITRNFYCRHGELDIIARESGNIAFIEVKSIVANPEVSPYELLSPTKLRRLQSTIDYWLTKNNLLSCSWRFEFIAVLLNESFAVTAIEHIVEPEL